MAHKSKGYIYTTDAVPSLIRNGALTFFNRLEHHIEQAATLVMHESSTHERLFTESEVRAMLRDIRHELELNARWQNSVEVISASAVIQAFHRPGVLSLDPA